MGGGGSCTVSRKEFDALRSPSLTLTVMVAVPIWLVTGVTRTVRLEPLPPNVMLAAGASAGLEELALSARLAAGLSMSPTVNAKSAVDWFFRIVAPSSAEMTGASLAGVTVNRKDRLAVARPSETETVTSVVPDWLGAGIRLRVRLLVDPAKVMAAFGSRVVFDETALITRPPGGVSPSPMVKAMPLSGVSSAVI